jgi:transcriptional regulator with XRE-family HTH domain
MASKPYERHDDPEGFGAWFVTLMRRNGYPVDGNRAGGPTRLAAESGVSLAVISKIMNGQRIPDVQTMVKFSPHLGTTVREMLLRSGRVLEEDLVAPTGNPNVDPVLDRIYGLDHLPIEVRKARAQDFLRRVEDARRLTEAELAEDLTRYQGEDGTAVANGT